MSPEPWRQSHCRSSIGEVQNAKRNQARRRKRTSRYGNSGDPSGDIEPDRATQRWHCPAPAVARAAPPLRERRVARPPPQGLQPVSWLAFSCSSPIFIQIRGVGRGFTNQFAQVLAQFEPHRNATAELGNRWVTQKNKERSNVRFGSFSIEAWPGVGPALSAVAAKAEVLCRAHFHFRICAVRSSTAFGVLMT
jgi:hypothetical protein